MEYLNKTLYEKAKKIADQKYKKHSAYKSAFIRKTYLELGGKVIEKNNKGLKKWINEDWKNLTPFVEGLGKKNEFKCGEKAKGQKNPSICRPLKLINNYTKDQLKKAVEIKKQGKIINWQKL